MILGGPPEYKANRTVTFSSQPTIPAQNRRNTTRARNRPLAIIEPQRAYAISREIPYRNDRQMASTHFMQASVRDFRNGGKRFLGKGGILKAGAPRPPAICRTPAIDVAAELVSAVRTLTGHCTHLSPCHGRNQPPSTTINPRRPHRRRLGGRFARNQPLALWRVRSARTVAFPRRLPQDLKGQAR